MRMRDAGMTFEEFQSSVARDGVPPAGLSAPLRALWLDGKGDWAGAHGAVDSLETKAAAHVHAYIHRKEGDLDNARYWYRRAGATPFSGSLDDEWAALVRRLLELEQE
jgi:hypothetical protein